MSRIPAISSSLPSITRLHTQNQGNLREFKELSINQAPEEKLRINNFFYVKYKRELVKLDVRDISHIEVEDRYSKIFLGNRTFICRLSLKQFKEILPPNQFIQSHRNYLVNTTFIDRVNLSENTIYLSNNTCVSFGDSYKEAIKNLFPRLT